MLLTSKFRETVWFFSIHRIRDTANKVFLFSWKLWFSVNSDNSVLGSNGYILMHRASPPLDWYQIVLTGDRGARVWTLAVLFKKMFITGLSCLRHSCFVQWRMTDCIVLTDESLDVDDASRSVASPTAGAVAMFIGLSDILSHVLCWCSLPAMWLLFRHLTMECRFK